MQKSSMPNEIILSEVSRLVSEGEQVVLMTKGVSMLPFIVGNRDSVLLTAPESFSVGDIVLARIDGCRYVLHRVIELDGDSVVLMGDGNIRGVEKCMKSDVTALALSIIRPDGSRIDCRSEKHLRQARLWRKLLPLRRWILAVYRRVYLRKSR